MLDIEPFIAGLQKLTTIKPQTGALMSPATAGKTNTKTPATGCRRFIPVPLNFESVA
jgi:hypothetical protein